jgi:hypothetical protein
MTKLLFICLALAAGAAQAQTYKCVDARGKITYTSTPCDDAGQKGGVVQDRMNTAPSQRVIPHSTDGRREPLPPKDEVAAKPPAAKPAPEPERRCFKTKTGTRCNDDTGDDDPTPKDDRSRNENRAQ